ncbi:MAG TPA: M64 family metallopeptidase [Pyrinomonadaceae bacterium]|nr:M64 family metallopeptidase [Pyrinomonadaceae bacterium]
MKSPAPPLRAILLLLAVAALGPAAAAEPVETIENNGDPFNRIDVVIVGDGYAAADMEKFRTDVQQFVLAMFDDEPLKEYRRYFNVHRVDVVSAQSGADHPENGSFRNTAFDATYNCSNIQRLICVNIGKVNTVVSNSLPAGQRELVVVIVNDPVYGGSGGSVVVSSTHTSAVEIVLHELGHTFGMLADEYTSSPPTCVNTVEPVQVNATRATTRDALKWGHWVAASTPIPTTQPTTATPGLYEGARYCTTGLYRPTFNSKMRSLGQPFEQINSEQLVRRVYNFVSPIDSFGPLDRTVTIPRGGQQAFNVATPAPATHGLKLRWLLNGEPLGEAGPALTLAADLPGAGTHLFTLEVWDDTPLVRNDPNQLLRESVTWLVTVGDQIDDTEFFVRQHYRDFLGREPDAAGLEFWANNIYECGADDQCIQERRVNVSAAFFLSIEFQNTGYLVHRFHAATFAGSLPRFQSFQADTAKISAGVVVGQAGWDTKLEENKQAFAREWVERAEVLEKLPAAMTASEFVAALFANAGVSQPGQAEVDAAAAAFGAGGTEGRARALRSVADSGSVYNKQYNSAFVLMQYFGYMRRNPDDPPDTDLRGYQFWLQKMNDFSLRGEDVRNESAALARVRRAEMVRAFISSIEYRRRFGQP